MSGKVVAADVNTGQVEAVESHSLNFCVASAVLTVKNAKAIRTDVVATDGVIHVNDTVVLPD